ncbi:MAG: carboxypeptidase regulatory-like domain-containing protein, partial [Ilumatobacteraceae bacterium]
MRPHRLARSPSIPGGTVLPLVTAPRLRARIGVALVATAAVLAGTLSPIAALGAAAAPVTTALEAETATFHVDAENGDDSADGLTPSTAWRTLDKVNATTFEPGQSILLRSGSSWDGQLWPKGSGVAGQPITIGRYGDGGKPVIAGNGEVADVVRLFNQEHWVISQLDVSNQRPAGATPGENLGDLRGIHVSGDNSTTLDSFVVSGVDVHDVSGEVNWISGDVAGNAPGVKFKTGWDGSKRTGGIVFDTTVPDILAPPAVPTILNDVTIENSTVVNTSFAGIIVKQYTGDGTDAAGNTVATSTGWGTRTSATDTKFSPHTDITIRGNYIRQDGTAYGCNGMYLTNIRGGLVEGNVVYRAGTSGIETYFADDIVIQHNEVYETQKKAGGADSNGIDPDKGTTRQLIQYNYIHGNGDGVLLCQFSFGDAVVRYNVIADNTRYPIYLHSDRAARAEVYNNTIYNSASNYLIYGYGTSLNATYVIRNNVIHSTRANATLTTSPTTDYENNLYSGAALMVPADDTSALVGDAGFVAPTVTGPFGTATTGPQLQLANGFATAAGTKAVNTGATITGAPAVDYAGAELPVGPTDIGAFEYSTAAGATTEVVSGIVRDTAGRALSGAAVKITSGSTVKTATTDATGWFRAPAVPFGSATVETTRTGYAGSPVPVAVASGSSAFVDVRLESTSNVGVVAGRVLDVAGAALADASVEVSASGRVLASGTTAADGSYSLADVAIGSGYTVTARSGTLVAAAVSAVQVDPGSTTTVKPILLQAENPTTIFSDDVESRPLGVFSSSDGYVVSRSGGSIDVVEVGDSRAFKLSRTTNSGSTSLSRSYATPLTGIVTIESRVMRDDPTTSAANWFSVPYVQGTNGANIISLALSKGKIIAYKGTASTELMSYQLGRWYTLTTVVDTVNQTFDLSIDGEKVVDDATFRAPLVGGIARIEYYANSSNYGQAHLDDLRILQGSERDTGDASLSSVDTDAGTPSVVDATRWRLDVPATVTELRVTATTTSAHTQGLTIAGEATASGEPSAPVVLAEGTTEIPIIVTAENGREVTYILEVERASLSADATLSDLVVDDATLEPAFSPEVEEYTLTTAPGAASVRLTATATGPSSITV